MKILFFSENFPPETNAAATRVYERACYWIKAGHDVTVITQAPNFPYGKIFKGYRNRLRAVEEMGGIRVVRVKTFMASNSGVILRTIDFLSFMLSGILAGLFEKKPDVVISTSPQFFVAVAGWFVGKMRRIPFVFELGDLWPASIVAVGAMGQGFLLRLVEKLELYLYRSAACVVALTPAFKKNLIGRGIDAGKIAVVINGVDLPRYRPVPRDREFAEKLWLTRNFVVGYVGTLGMAHGLENVLAAAHHAREEPNIRFLFAGPGAVRERLMKLADEEGLGNVVFLAPQPKEKVPAVWSLCDVALVHLKDSPVFAEVIPSKIFEAMAMGLPILLIAPKGEATAIVEADEAGLIVPPENPEALADAAIRLARDQTLREKLAKNALTAAARHSREHQANQMMAAIEAAAAGRGDEAGARVEAVQPPKAPAR